jgi:hypothetical protein
VYRDRFAKLRIDGTTSEKEKKKKKRSIQVQRSGPRYSKSPEVLQEYNALDGTKEQGLGGTIDLIR